MRPFKYFRADSLDAVATIVSDHDNKAKMLAGGTDLLGTMREDIHAEYPPAVVDLKPLNDLAYIKESDHGLAIGSLTKIHQLATNKIVKEKYPVLAQAAGAVASPQLRRMGTVGGNICQEPRCWYYRYPKNYFPCTRKGGKYCNAFTGENRFHSIFGAVRVEPTPCTVACPGGVEIPVYMAQLRAGDLKAAAETLLEANPIPAVTGRICPHLCEQECNRGQYDEAVSIRGVERYVGDYILDNTDQLMKPPETDTGRKVAIVGSGAAGLSAAFYLRKLGHRVAIFDKNEAVGGMLTYAVPSYRLPKEVIHKITGAMEAIGVEFRLGVNVGRDVSVAHLRETYDAVFLATGAWAPVSIGLKGEEHTTPGLEFLIGVQCGSRQKPGSKIVVIGGGNVAVDVAITARRLGAEEVTMACLERREEMPAFEWEVDQTLGESVRLMPGWGPARVHVSEGGVTGLDLVRCTSVFDEAGRFRPKFDKAVSETLEADRIFLAVGQRSEISTIGLGLLVEGGAAKVDPVTQETNIPGVFAGGDASTGPATAIEAVAAGRRAAMGIDRHLKGLASQAGLQQGRHESHLLEFDAACLHKSSRSMMPERAHSERNIDGEDALGLDFASVEIEAKRCFNCGCVAVSPSDLAPALIAMDARIKTTKRTLDAGEFFTARPQGSTVLDTDEVVLEVVLPVPGVGHKSAFCKFRLRNSIDFPIVSVASALRLKSGKIEQARIVLGAVAPVPLRIRMAEDQLKGKRVTEEIVEEAAAVAIKAARPLAKNDYKIQITKALIKRAIMAAVNGNGAQRG
jgi:NADPH-dependent glutamate synthase beta subunit-like oxidoreductase/CO/xanthine dehydrogenase FAD-binding subunit